MRLKATATPTDSGYGQKITTKSQSWRKWCTAAAAALLLNCLLFLLLPAIIRPDKVNPDQSTIVRGIEVVRLKRPEPPPKQKEKKPPEPEKEEPQKKDHAPPETIAPPKLTLPLDLNPRLPAAPADLQLPLVEAGPLQPGTMDGVSVRQLDQPLSVLTRIQPNYPLRARRRGIEGKVVVRFLVDEEGAVSQLSIVNADPPGIFEKSVLQCVAKWRYTPGTVESVPVRAWMETTISFKLE